MSDLGLEVYVQNSVSRVCGVDIGGFCLGWARKTVFEFLTSALAGAPIPRSQDFEVQKLSSVTSRTTDHT
jgi:hypothetical protein